MSATPADTVLAAWLGGLEHSVDVPPLLAAIAAVDSFLIAPRAPGLPSSPPRQQIARADGVEPDYTFLSLRRT